MNPDRIAGALAALPRFDSDDRRAARTRSLCQEALAKRRPRVERAAPEFASRLFPPLAVAWCLVFLSILIAQAERILHFTP